MFSILFFMSLLQGMIWDVFQVVENYFREHEIEEMHIHQEEEERAFQHNLANDEGMCHINFHDGTEGPTSMKDSPRNMKDDSENSQGAKDIQASQRILKEKRFYKTKTVNPIRVATQILMKVRKLKASNISARSHQQFENEIKNEGKKETQQNEAQSKEDSIIDISAIGEDFQKPGQNEQCREVKLKVFNKNDKNTQHLNENNFRKYSHYSSSTIKEEQLEQQQSNQLIIRNMSALSITDEGASANNMNAELISGCEDIADEELANSQTQQGNSKNIPRQKQFLIRFGESDLYSQTDDQSIANERQCPSIKSGESPEIRGLVQEALLETQSVSSEELLINENENENENGESKQDKSAFVRKEPTLSAQLTKESTGMILNSKDGATQTERQNEDNNLFLQVKNQEQRKVKMQDQYLNENYSSREQDIHSEPSIYKLFNNQSSMQLNDADRYFIKRSQRVNYQMNLMHELNQLEGFLHISDQINQKRMEQQRERILNKHKILNKFTISKQHALQKMTYLKDNSVNKKYSKKQDYLSSVEHSLGQTSDHKKLGLSRHTHSNIFYSHSNDNYRGGGLPEAKQYGSTLQANYLEEQNDIVTLSEFDECSNGYSFSSKVQSIIKQKMKRKKKKLAEDAQIREMQMNDQTFLKLNNLFSFLLHLLTNCTLLDRNFLIQKLFTIEYSINQIIYGVYNECHIINHFKFVFYSSTSNKFLVLIKEHDIDNSYMTSQKGLSILVKSLPNDCAPWSVLGKSLPLEKTIYMIRSLFGTVEPSEVEIAKQISNNIQYMRGFEFCLEDLTPLSVELFTSFIYSARDISMTKPNSSQKNSNSPFIGFICSRQTSLENTQSRKSSIHSEGSIPDSSLNQSKESFHIISNQKGAVFRRSSQRPPQGLNFEVTLPENKPQELLSNNPQDLRTKHLSQINKSRIKRNNEPNIESLKKGKEVNKLEQKHSVQEQSFRMEDMESLKRRSHSPSLVSGSYHPRFATCDKPNNLQLHIPMKRSPLSPKSPMIKRNQLLQEQEHIVKVYHQIQQFFSTHAHLLNNCISHIQSELVSTIPCYQ